jgi:hypothetical protein
MNLLERLDIPAPAAGVKGLSRPNVRGARIRQEFRSFSITATSTEGTPVDDDVDRRLRLGGGGGVVGAVGDAAVDVGIRRGYGQVEVAVESAADRDSRKILNWLEVKVTEPAVAMSAWLS